MQRAAPADLPSRKRHGSGLQTAFEEKTEIFFLTDRSSLAGPFYDRARGAPGPWRDGSGVAVYVGAPIGDL
eukprot:3824387-Prymnesium_polylepis.1